MIRRNNASIGINDPVRFQKSGHIEIIIGQGMKVRPSFAADLGFAAFAGDDGQVLIVGGGDVDGDAVKK